MATLRYLGSVTMAVAVPIVVTAGATLAAAIGPLGAASATVSASIAPIVAGLSARASGLASLAFKIGIKPPGIAASLETAAKIVAAFNAAAALTPPSVDFAASAVAKATLEVEAQLSAINAVVDLVAELGGIGAVLADLKAQLDAITGAAGVRLYLYEGTIADFGATIDAELNAGGVGGLGAGISVFSPVLVVESANGSAVLALNKLFAVA
jgi:hypothetical protein